MTVQTDPYSAEAWEIDLGRKLARHLTGLVVYVTNDFLYPGKWTARRSKRDAMGAGGLFPRPSDFPDGARPGWCLRDSL
jgi:hypothetical protein